jgi:hypothetical protein
MSFYQHVFSSWELRERQAFPALLNPSRAEQSIPLRVLKGLGSVQMALPPSYLGLVNAFLAYGFAVALCGTISLREQASLIHIFQ